MGNFNSYKYQVNNSSMSSKKSHSFFGHLGCNILKNKKKKNVDYLKSKSLNFEENDEVKICNASLEEKELILQPIKKNTDSQSQDASDTSCTQNDNYVHIKKGPTMYTYPRLSESSLNSDDLMLGTDVNLDQADDDVSKDYNASEKEDPFILENNNTIQESIIKTHVENISSQPKDFTEMSADESEKNDIVSFNSSRENSDSTQRKIFGKGFSLRPHSFSSPLKPSIRDNKITSRRNSNLSTVDSVDFAWTWISASETANLSQDISNLKLMLLKMKRLLLDETSNDVFNCNLRTDGSPTAGVTPNVFSEPSTPLCNNNLPNSFANDTDTLQARQWENMTKEMLIQELNDLQQQNGDLQFQLKEKSRIVAFLQEQQQSNRINPRRLHSASSKSEGGYRNRIIRSSTFETASTLYNQTLSQDADFLLGISQEEKAC